MALELLSPAQDMEMLQAAVQTGADGVCLIAPIGEMRDTFSADELIEAIKYTRLRGIKAYVYFSGLVTDDELLRLKTLVAQVNEAGVDAVFAGDMGLIRMIRNLAPNLAIFGTEQIAVHNLAGAMAAKKMGLSRVWLARELSLEQIKFICDRIDIQVQVFCHGAQCVSYSGQCYMSGAVTSRSANRGKCMQPCKMAYSYFGDAPAEHLSLKDMCLVQHLGELERVGVTAAFIEGRGKRAEYIALATDMYRKSIESKKAPSRGDIIKLEGLFARDGFSDGYLRGDKSGSMFGIPNGAPDREVKSAYNDARKMYQGNGEKPLVSVDMFFSAKEGEEMTLICRDYDGNEYEVYSPVPAYSKKDTSKSEIDSWLRRTEKTVFAVQQCHIDIDSNLRITPAAVAAMRKNCLEGLALRRRLVPERPVGTWQPGLKRLGFREKPRLALSFLKTEQITPEILDAEPEIVYLPLHRMYEDSKIIELLRGRGIIPCAVLDRVTSDKEWPEVIMELRELKKAGLEHIMCTNPGQAVLLESLGFILRGDFGMNVLNSQSIKELKALGLSSCTLSFEMSFLQMKELSMGLDCEIIVYGRQPLMVTENCIIHKHNGTHTCHNGATTLIDKTGRSYPLLPEKGCRNTLYNAEKLWLADKKSDYEHLGLRTQRLCFTTENSKECLKVVQAYLGKAEATPERATRGMYYRGNI